MKRLMLVSVICAAGLLVLTGAKAPSVEEVKSKIRREHPRLFLTPETLNSFADRANGPGKAYLNRVLMRVKSYPKDPKLEVEPRLAEMKDDKLVFHTHSGDQDNTGYGVKCTGGVEAMNCAIAYLATGKKEYRELALKFMKLSVEFIELADRSKIMTEWYHNSRFCALTSYDWLYNTLSDEDRKGFIVPLLKHVKHMIKPGYQVNSGSPSTGAYGETPLRWYAGLAGYGDGYDDALADELLTMGYRSCVATMDHREKLSAGSGLLTSIAANYSFGAYPWFSFNFLYTLNTGCGIDGTRIWSQMRDYPNYFNWMTIPSYESPGQFCEFGWGDSFHTSNVLDVGSMYSHLAQAIHFYGKESPDRAKQARAAIEMLPEESKAYCGLSRYPHWPFVAVNFDPQEKNDLTPEQVFSHDTATNFPSFGLTVMRSGSGPNDTYASIKAGASQDAHQHLDENTFIIYKKGFQALDTGTRGKVPHHKAYYAQTIAHNGILIRTPNDPLGPHWYPANAVKTDWTKIFNDGGQNQRLKCRSLGFDESPYHAATGGDATACYSSAKCKEAVRQFVFIKPDYFVVYDRVTSVKPDQQKVFLLHTQNKPIEAKGVWRGCAGEGAIFMKTLLPAGAKGELVGGDGQECVVNGVNYPAASSEKAPRWQGRFRIEVSPAEAAAKTRFLTVLQASLKDTPEMVATKLVQTETEDGVELTTAEGKSCRVMFTRDGLIGGSIEIRQDGKALVKQPCLGGSDCVFGDRPRGVTPGY
jgi:heparin/heparan-sulfate lyase